MPNKKVISNSLFLIAFFCFWLVDPVYSATTLVMDAADSTGKWDKRVVTQRVVAFSAKPLSKSEVRCYVASPGKYQLFAYIYHNWENAVPCIYVEAIDAKGVKHKGYHRIENIWYRDKVSSGRWFFVSLAQNPYWELPQGDLIIRFWADAEKAVWDERKVPMEDGISIDKFFLVPVSGSDAELTLPYFIYPESGEGNWENLAYDNQYATNLIKTGRNNAYYSLMMFMPNSGYYTLGISAFSLKDNNFTLSFEGKTTKQNTDVAVRANKNWSFVYTHPVYLSRGNYKLTLKHLGQNEILLDYLLVCPDPKKEN